MRLLIRNIKSIEEMPNIIDTSCIIMNSTLAPIHIDGIIEGYWTNELDSLLKSNDSESEIPEILQENLVGIYRVTDQRMYNLLQLILTNSSNNIENILMLMTAITGSKLPNIKNNFLLYLNDTYESDSNIYLMLSTILNTIDDRLSIQIPLVKDPSVNSNIKYYLNNNDFSVLEATFDCDCHLGIKNLNGLINVENISLEMLIYLLLFPGIINLFFTISLNNVLYAIIYIDQEKFQNSFIIRLLAALDAWEEELTTYITVTYVSEHGYQSVSYGEIEQSKTFVVTNNIDGWYYLTDEDIPELVDQTGNYTFIGWFDEGGNQYSVGYEDPNYNHVWHDITLYAHWSAIAN